MKTALVIFARAPEPGAVKTRLIPALGADGAARLHLAFVDDACALSRGLGATRTLAVAGDARDPALAAIAAREAIPVVAQASGDLGARMAHAIRDALYDGADAALVVGTDAPALPRAFLQRALAALAVAEVVVGPARDGGYWAVGARADLPWLFAGMPWGTGRVLALTVEKLRSRGARWTLADEAWDVDRPEDLARLVDALARDPALAPATRSALAAIVLPSGS